MPERPPKGWFYKVRKQVKRNYPDRSEQDINRITAGIWHKMSESQRAAITKKHEHSPVKRVSAEVMPTRKLEVPEVKKMKEWKEPRPYIPPPPPPPSGKRNQYDMEVEKATHEADARKIEAEEKRKGYEAIAGGIRDGFGSLGWNIGAGASGGPARSGPSPEAQTEARVPAAEPQPMDWRDEFWHTRCVYSDCHAPMAFEDGKSTVMCPSCNRVIQVQPTEEELKQKVSAEKSKTPETKIEAKKEEPKREEPRREEEKPPETEKPESAEEKPIAEAKVPKASEGSDAKAAEEASGPAS